MRIAVFGYYNSLNAGDDRLQTCITRIVRPGGDVVFLPHNKPPPIEFLRDFDWILIGGGGLVFEHVGIWKTIRKWTRKCRARIGVVGLGINLIGPELKKEVGDLIDIASFFYVRDNRSKELLNDDARVEVWPDVTWAFPFRRNANIAASQSIAVNLAPCNWRPFDPDAWIDSLGSLIALPFPFYFTPSQDFGLLRKYYGDAVPSEFSLNPLHSCSVLVASRFHAIVFAMQMRIPFVAISYDDKVRRLVEDAGLAYYCLETHEHMRLRAVLDRLHLESKAVVNLIDEYAATQELLAIKMINRIRQKMGISAEFYP